MNPEIEVLIADDHPVVRMGLAGIIARHPQCRVVGQAVNGYEAVEMFSTLRPHIVLMDLRMPSMSGVEAIEAIRKIDHRASIVILTTFDGEEDIYQGIKAGAKAYLLKDAPSEDVIECIIAVAEGRKYIPPLVAAKLADRVDSDQLSERELEILKQMAEGKSNKQIAKLTSITEGTVKYHVNNILHKLGAERRTEAVSIALKRGILHRE